MPSVKSPKSEILPGIIRSDSPCHSYRPRSSTSPTTSNRISSSNSNSMTNGNSLRLRLLLLSNIFGLLSRTQALPFEYLDEHDDFNYDLDTAQSQAKYDARLLSQQMLSDAELLQQTGGTGPPWTEAGLDAHTVRAQGGLSDGSVEDLEPHSRAAACFTNGHKYTHGQKVPRQDACEVCLCMDGEIFCWWERCDKANANKVKATAAGNANDNDNDNGKGKSKVKEGGFGVGFGFGGDGGNGDSDGAAGVGVGDYSDPYRHESTTRKSTKVHKTAGKVGKRRKHRRNQKNFNDYEVIHSHKQQQQQQQPQPPDYKKSAINQQQQQQQQQQQDQEQEQGQQEHQIQKQKSSDASNYNIIKQHKHEQHQKVAEKQEHQKEQQQAEQEQQQGQQQEQSVVASPVNQAAAKETQQLATTTTPSHQQQHNSHPHRPPHSSSKILNFPENLPALLYYDYKTEEHEHHQHQHHQQHLLHEKQRLQHQQEALARQKPPADAGVELHTDLGVDKNFDEAETDSDILPEPPTKRPKAPAPAPSPSTAPTQWTTSSSPGSSMAKALMTNQAATSTAATTTTTTTTTTKTTTTTRTNGMATGRLSGQDTEAAEVGYGATVEATNLQADRSGGKDLDDAFHRWLTSTELNADSTNSADDASEQETAASTIIDDVAIRNKSDSGTRGNGSGSGGGRRGSSSSTSGKDNASNNVADAVFFRSSYNDYSSEFNGSVVNIDITLTAVDVHPRRQTDLIANGNRTSSCVGAEATPETTAGTTMDPQANDRGSTVPVTTSSTPHNNNNNNEDQPMASGSPVVPPYTLTTIITTTPLAPGRMCDVLGKLYKIGDILPQETGNCLQCICTDAVTPDEIPSVTCSPHNCPPLVLPDLFDATGY